MKTDDHTLAGSLGFDNEAEHIFSLEKRVELLQRQLKELIDDDDEQPRLDRGAQALQLAEMIIDNSPAVLFRRRASEELKERKMVYVSPNISRFGYRADDHGDDDNGATSLGIVTDSVEIAGIIEQNTDVDVFSFSADSGTLRLDVDPIEQGAGNAPEVIIAAARNPCTGA